ncbi:type II toxin-antitoxin system HicB family antitoxin [Candidatus Azambacteria bacterium]|nr:type II toxin-antitoxin system HicB family antitoxin [Candidatus Azambacteria bacterium]
MSKINLKSVVWKEGDYYISQCLDVDISSFGKTKKQALIMLQDALELYFEDTVFPLKTELIKNPLIASITIQHA